MEELKALDVLKQAGWFGDTPIEVIAAKFDEIRAVAQLAIAQSASEMLLEDLV